MGLIFASWNPYDVLSQCGNCHASARALYTDVDGLRTTTALLGGRRSRVGRAAWSRAGPAGKRGARMRGLFPFVAVALGAAYIVEYGLGEGKPGMLAIDVYGYFYPQMLYALHRLALGGSGLLWNRYQNCGQPFFGITESGLLYPLNLLFLLITPEAALRALLWTNLMIGGLGVYALGCEIGGSEIGAGTGALAFVLGSSAYHVTAWMPTVQAPYMWMPVGMLCCERLLKAPSVRTALLLGVVLAVALLPGHPQFVMFTCMLAVMRVGWAVFSASERRHLAYAAGGLVLGFAVMLLLTAVQFIPSLEVIGESVRHTSLTPSEIAPRGPEMPADIAGLIIKHSSLAPFTLIPGFFAVASVLHPRCRRTALFYLLAAGFFLVLS